MDPVPSSSRTRSEERLTICRECPFLFKPTMTCKKCGCFLKVKTRLSGSTCPEGRW